jgi:hypothetical protein
MTRIKASRRQKLEASTIPDIKMKIVLRTKQHVTEN